MKSYIILFFCCLLSISSFSQIKCNYEIAKRIEGNDNKLISVFVKGDIETIISICEINGGIYKYSAGDIAVVEIEANKLTEFIANENITRVEAYPNKSKPLNDTMLINNNVIPVHTGQSPLTQSYDGTDVVIGFIDTGIDFTHPDFRDSSGKSRIKFLWDQTLTTGGTKPLPYNYGQEWTGAQIDLGQAVGHNDLTYAGHGTHVASIASGNGRANGTHKGVAPNSDIIFVALDFASPSSTLITDAVNYIFSKASQMGKPCVINASLGDYEGSHDGQDLQAQLMKNMMNLQPGRSIVAAAGNAGDNPFHLGYTVTSDTNFTFFLYSAPSINFTLWADTSDFKNVNFSIGADKISPYSNRGRISFSKIDSRLGFIKRDTLFNAGNRIGIIETFGDLIGATYSLNINIIPDSTTYAWRFITTGTGKFDLWSFDMVDSGLPTASVLTDSIYYKYPDTDQTIVSSFQCLDEIITVANYSNRKQYIDYNNTLFVNPSNIAGNLHPSSSKGPTRDGRVKPDISSPGDMTVAAVVLSLKPGIISNYPDALAQGGFHVRSGGTSHSCPGVAGVAALYLQKKTSATAAEIKQAIENCARQDSFTGTSLPNNSWGHGKVDAFKTLTNCYVVSADEMNEESKMIIYPNPISSGNIINVDLKYNHTKTELRIYNSLGALVRTYPVNSNKTIIEINTSPGMYIIDLIQDNFKVATKKMIVL